MATRLQRILFGENDSKNPPKAWKPKHEVNIHYKTGKTKDQSASKRLPLRWRVRLQDHHNFAPKNAALLLFDLQEGLCEFCCGWERISYIRYC